MSGLRDAVGFLTRVPVRATAAPGPGAVAWFPVVGALVALVVAAVYAGLYQVMPSPLAALGAVVTGVLVTGGFHEDGFADTADALGSRRVGEDGLEIMKDPRVGTYGALAVVVSVLWRVLAVGSLDPIQALAGLVMAHTLGRAAAVVLMATSPAARQDGLGRSAFAEVSSPGAWFAVGSALALSALVGGWWLVPSAVLVVLVAGWIRQTSVDRFGGVTGDVLGACEQFGEILALAVVIVAAWGGSTVWWVG